MIPKDTFYFHYYNANPKNKIAGDCVIRALSVAMDKQWDDVFRDLCEIALKYRVMPNDKKCYGRYLKQNGWVKMKQPKKDSGKKYTGLEFCKLQQFGDMMHEPVLDGVPVKEHIIAHIGGHHIVAIESGTIWDTWNSADGCIGNYWVREVR